MYGPSRLDLLAVAFPHAAHRMREVGDRAQSGKREKMISLEAERDDQQQQRADQAGVL